jgi:hypothetical protein
MFLLNVKTSSERTNSGFSNQLRFGRQNFKVEINGKSLSANF